MTEAPPCRSSGAAELRRSAPAVTAVSTQAPADPAAAAGASALAAPVGGPGDSAARTRLLDSAHWAQPAAAHGSVTVHDDHGADARRRVRRLLPGTFLRHRAAGLLLHRGYGGRPGRSPG